jgi:serine phosphatase RsbU (regulator of sigma subunit)
VRVDSDAADDAAITDMLRFAGLVSQLIVTKSRYTDVFARAAQRVTPSVAAHVQWSQLPPMTFTTPRVAIAGILEPAYDIGGDAFDYAHTDDRTDIVMLDAMGHGLKACWPATLAMAGLRHARQRGLGLAERYDECSRLLARELSAYEFVAAQLAELDSTTGLLRWVNAGLPKPLLVRGGKVIGELPCQPNLPLGVAIDGGSAKIASISLEPWDRVLFFTDGVIEGHRPGNEPFGIERLVDLLGRESLAQAGPAEAVRRVAHAVLDHNNHDLRDDFTMLLVEFRGGGADVEAVPHTYRLPNHRTV